MSARAYGWRAGGDVVAPDPETGAARTLRLGVDTMAQAGLQGRGVIVVSPPWLRRSRSPEPAPWSRSLIPDDEAEPGVPRSPGSATVAAFACRSLPFNSIVVLSVRFEPGQLRARPFWQYGVMTAELYRCPNSATNVQQWIDDEPDAPSDSYVVLNCPSCGRIHFMSRMTNRLLLGQEGSSTSFASSQT
jgi:hypothetical protein